MEEGEGSETQAPQGWVGARRGESTVILLSSWAGLGLLQGAIFLVSPPNLPPPQLGLTALGIWPTCRNCQLAYAEGSGHLVGGQDGGEDTIARQERLAKMGFSSSRQGGMQAADGLGKPLLRYQHRLTELFHAGPLRPLAGLNFGLSLSPRAIAFTDLA